MPAEVQAGKPQIDLSRYELRLDGRRVKLERQPMELLIFLVQRQGELVTREDMVVKLWGKDVFVDVDRSINGAIRKIRAALGDDPDEPKFLETVVGKGYRLIGEIALTQSPPKGSAKSSEATTPATIPAYASRKIPSALAISALAIALIAATALGWFRLRHRVSAQRTQIHSLAVLPFVNLSGDGSQDYFADGMTDELITNVAQVAALRVISETSAMQYKHSQKSLPQIARELGVDAVVEGSVVQIGDKVRITAQLVDAREDRHLWAQSYERNFSELLALQNEVSRDIAQQVRVEITPAEQARLDAPRHLSADNYMLYLKGLYFYKQGSESSTAKAIEYFQQIANKDPTAAIAYAAMADAYGNLGMDNVGRARVAARKAIELDDNLAEAHSAMGSILQQYDWDFSRAEKEFQHALSLNPNLQSAHSRYGTLLAALGRNQEALQQRQEALALDPLSIWQLSGTAMTLFMGRHFREAAELERQALEMEPDFEPAHFWLGYVYEQQRQYVSALAEYRKIDLAYDNHFVNRAAIGRAYALAGRHRDALKIEAELRSMSGHAYVWPYHAALFYAALGQKDRAFQWLDKCFKDRDGWLTFLNVDPRLDSLRSDPRFAQLVARVGLPSAPDSLIR